MDVLAGIGSPQEVLAKVVGEVDADQASLLEDRLVGIWERSGQPGLVVDLADVTFLGVAGTRALVLARDRLLWAGASLRVRAAPPLARHILELMPDADVQLLESPGAAVVTGGRGRASEARTA
jgi:anti-anti-sigma factor